MLACLLSVIFSNVRAQADDPVVMNINGEDILRSEFEYNWKKNYNISSTDKKNLDEYQQIKGKTRIIFLKHAIVP